MRIGSVQDPDFSRTYTASAEFLRFEDDPVSFFPLIGQFAESDPGAFSVLRPQRLVFSAFIAGNNLIRRIKDIRCRPVILFQLNNLGVRIILFKIQNVADICASPAIDGLIVIANNTEVSAFCRNQPYKHVLCIIGILVLVHVDIADSSLVCFQHGGTGCKQFQRLHQQIVKVQSVGFAHLRLISPINVIKPLRLKTPVALRKPFLR